MGKSSHPKKLTSPKLISKLSSGPWKDVWRRDIFGYRTLAIRPPIPLEAETEGLTKLDTGCVRTWLEERGETAYLSDIQLAIEQIAKTSPVHPVREFLSGCPASPGILNSIALSALGTDPHEHPMADIFLRKWLIAAVRRIQTPGTKVDTMLVLIGGQGKLKSSLFAELFGPWFSDQMPDIHGRDGSHALEGNWCIEFGECHKLMKTDKEVVKDYLARSVDKYRQYGNGDHLVRPRQNVFAGTTNQESILRDETGDRRFWPIPVSRIDLDWIRTWRKQIWGEAARLEASGELHYLTPTEEIAANTIREDYREEGHLDEALRVNLRGKAEFVTVAGMCRLIHHREPLHRGESNEIAAGLRRLGCLPTRRQINGIRCKGFIVPESFRGKSTELEVN